MDIQSFKKALDRLDVLHKQQRYEDAFKLVEDLIAQHPYSVELLVRRAKLIQLLDKEDPSKLPQLEMALGSLKLARTLAPHAIEPCIELGYFEYAVNDRPDEAVKYFEAALENAESGLKDALTGLIKCYAEIDKMSRARQILEKAKVLFPDDSDLGILESELEE